MAEKPAHPITDRRLSPFVFLDEKELARRLSVSRRTLQRWRLTGEGPPFARLGRRRIGYPVGTLEGWERAHTFAHRAAEAAQAVTAAE